MGFFDPVLRLDPADKVRLALLADSARRIAIVAEAFLAKANEPPPVDDEMVPVAEVQALIDDWAAKLRATRLHSEEEIARLTEGATARVVPPAIPQP